MSIIYNEIQPSNINSTQKVSYKQGNPIVNFLIGTQPHLLDAGSVRISGDITFYKNSAKDKPTSADQLGIDEKLALYSIIDKVTITSQRSRQVIETVNHYGRFLASYSPYVNSKADKFTHGNVLSGALPNFGAQKKELVDFPATAHGSHFCINLPTGFLTSGNKIPLSAGSLGGVEISLNLAPDSQVLYAKNGTTVGLTDAYYELSNLRLHCEVIVPQSPADLPSQGQLTYNAITSYFNVINSANAVVNFNLGTSRTLGVFMNMCPSKYLNNLKYNSFATTTPLNSDGSQADIKSIIITKAGVRMPFAFNLDTNVKDSTKTSVVDPQVVTFARDSIAGGMRSQISPINTNRTYTGATPPLTADGGPMECIGVPFDTVGTGMGEDFSNVPFGIQMELGLDSDSPNALFLFVHSRQTLLFSQQGIQLIM